MPGTSVNSARVVKLFVFYTTVNLAAPAGGFFFPESAEENGH